MNPAIPTGIGPQKHPSPWSLGRAIGDPGAPQIVRGRALGALAMVLAAVVVGVPVAGADDGATLAALEIAYGREMNAHAHRLAYAAAAEREGHCEAAGLFRASATAESVHAVRIGAAIEQLDARPSWALASVAVRGTADNLRSCLEREIDERDRIYPCFARVAREECLYAACAVLQDVQAAGGTQAVLFEAALGRLDREQTPPAIAMAASQAIGVIAVEDCATSYSVCPGDGSLFTGPIAGRCPNCGTRGSCALVLASRSGASRAVFREGACAVAAR